MAKKVRIKKRNVGIAVGILVVIVIAIIGIIKWKQKMDYQATDEYKLLTIGYSEDDTQFLIENLKEDDLNKLIENEVLNENIINLFKQEYFLYKNLDDYLAYADENPDKQLSEVIAIINVGTNKNWYDKVENTDTSKGNLILVNKFYKLQENYEPDNLVSIKDWYAYPNAKVMNEEAYHKFISMYNDAKEENISLAINYSYRTYAEQDEIYNYYNSQYGSDYADGYAARPGHSEHQTGLVIDLLISKGYDKTTFDTSPEYAWLEKNAHKYGYILRYPKDKEHITGYSYESWHFRYVGVEVATYIYEHNITFDEYYAYFIAG